jgi:putative membrane protein
MMPGYGGMGGWGWMFMSLSSFVFIALLGVTVWLLVRATGPGRAPQPRDSTSSAREILAQRYARGEIDEQEYRQRLHTLGG